MSWFNKLILMVLMFTVGALPAVAGVTYKAQTTIRKSADLDKNEIYELAKFKVCQKALQQHLQGDSNIVLRRNWDVLRPEQEIFAEPHKYFTSVRITEKGWLGKNFRIKAEVTIDDSALESLINMKAGNVVDRLNAVGLSVLFLARTADKEIDYRRDSSAFAAGSNDDGEVESNSTKSTKQQTAFTTRAVDTTEILTNITSRLTDSGIRLYSVRALLPYIEESERLEEHLRQVSLSYAGRVDKYGVYRSGSTEKEVAYIQNEIKKLPDHPRYFALGKIDIGNTVYDEDTGMFRGLAKCSITLWDLDGGRFPIKIATTPLMTAKRVAEDKKEASKNAAEQVATHTGNEILDRIRSVMLEEFYRNKSPDKQELDLVELIGVVSIEVDDDRIDRVRDGELDNRYQQALNIYDKKRYREAFVLFSELADQGYIPARNMLGRLYYFGHGVGQNSEKALDILSLGLNEDDVDGQAAYYLALMYYYGIDGKKDYLLGRELLNAAVKKEYPSALNEMGHIYFNGVGVEQDNTEALKWFTKAGEKSNFLGLYNLGYMYLYGYGVEQDISSAIEYFEKSSSIGYGEADFMLADLYRKGVLVGKDMAKALHYYQRAVEYSHPEALLQLGYMYSDGDYVEKNYSKALELFRKAASRGNLEAECAVGIAFENGYGVARNYEQALKHYNKAAAENYHYAFTCLGTMYRDGRGVKQDYKRAIEYFEKGVETGNIKAKVDLGFMYLEGLGVNKDYKKAAELIGEAARDGSAIGQYNYGYFFEHGEGVDQDYREAAKWYRKAVDNGHLSAANNLGIIYLEGYGVSKDYHEAKRLFEFAVEGGHANACGGLGSLYRDGNGVEQNIYTAINLYEKGGARGSDFCYMQLAFIFINGTGIPIDFHKAYAYCKKAADLGNAQGMYIIGAMYHDGKGVSRDANQAINWYRKAADNGYPDALFTLGRINEQGLFGIAINYKDAVYWYKRAAEKGHAKAQERVKALRYAY